MCRGGHGSDRGSRIVNMAIRDPYSDQFFPALNDPCTIRIIFSFVIDLIRIISIDPRIKDFFCKFEIPEEINKIVSDL